MDQKELRRHLERLASTLEGEKKLMLEARLESLVSAFPFNEYEYILMFLLDTKVITFEEYEKLRDNYISSNKYLDLYGLAPRIFGQVWGEQHVMDLDSRFKKADKSIDPGFRGEYDLWAEGIKVEVKACRATDTKTRGDLVSKALRYESQRPFWMNFQQLKLDVCDVFVFIGVWVDRIVYWVLSRKEVESNPYLSHQHRGGVEYQIGITHKNIGEFDTCRMKPAELYDKVLSASGDR